MRGLHFLLAASAIGMAASANAAVVADDFNSYTNEADFVQGGAPTGPWSSRIGDRTDMSMKTATSAESPFTAVTGGNGVLVTDASTADGDQYGFKQSFATTIDPITVRFDYIVYNSTGGAGLEPTLALLSNSDPDPRGQITTNFGPVFYLFSQLGPNNYTMGFRGSDGWAYHDLQAVELNKWYQIEIQTSLSIPGTYSIKVTPDGGLENIYTTGTTANAGTASANEIQFYNNGDKPSMGSWAVDNLQILGSADVPEPASIALSCIGLSLLVRRRR